MARAARIVAVCAAAALALLSAAPAHADDLVRPKSMDKPPAGYRLTGRQAEQIADRSPTAIHARRSARGVFDNVFEKSGSRWQVSYYVTHGKDTKEIAQIYVSDVTGKVTEAWTGPQVAWTMARGYPGAFGRKVNSPFVWIALTLLFMVPFVDRPPPAADAPPRPRRAHGLRRQRGLLQRRQHRRLGAARVPAAGPTCSRACCGSGCGRSRPRDPAAAARCRPAWLVVGLLFLVGFRIGLNVADSNVIDVGYAGVIGAGSAGRRRQAVRQLPQGQRARRHLRAR
jgi:hypothetical protein